MASSSLVLNTNTASLNAQNKLGNSTSSLTRVMERLSSGSRINSARDDAAGLQISNRLTNQISGLGVAVRNANDGISMAQTAEGALQQSTTLLQRMRDLALQSANGSNSSAERSALNDEASSLKAELNRISDTTTFGGQKLLDGSFGNKNFQVGSNANETISMTLGSSSSTKLGSYQTSVRASGASATVAPSGLVTGTTTGAIANNLASGSMSISGSVGNATTSTVSAGSSAEMVASAINNISSQTGVTADARTVVQLSGLSVSGTVSFNLTGNSTAAISATIPSGGDLRDLATAINAQTGKTGITAELTSTGQMNLISEEGDDVVLENFTTSAGASTMTVSTMDYKGTTSLASTSIAGGATSGASFRAVGNVRMDSASAFSASGSTANGTMGSASGAAATSTLAAVSTIDLSTQSGAQDALAIIDSALSGIDKSRSALGALQNRFDNTISNLQNISENASSARSRIQDTDYAADTAELSKYQIRQQAGTAILAQAKQLPQQILSLLQ